MFTTIVIAAVISAILAMGLGAFWYGKTGFGPVWMKLAGITMSEVKATANGMTPAVGMGIGLIAAIIKGLAVAFLLTLLNPITVLEALGYGVLFWIGFQATIDVGVVLWNMKSWKLFYLNTSYNLIATLIMVTVAFYLL